MQNDNLGLRIGLARKYRFKGAGGGSSPPPPPPPPENVAPTSVITTPTAGTVLTGGYFPVEVTATDSDGSIVRVELYGNGDFLYVDALPEYSFSLFADGYDGQTLTLVARAVDDDGAYTDSAPVPVVIAIPPPPPPPPPPANTAPTVSITNPTAGITIATIPTTVTIAASDSDGTISNVELFVNGTLAGSDTTSPYNITISPANQASMTLMARATDDDGAMTNSATVVVTVDTGPITDAVTVMVADNLDGGTTTQTNQITLCGSAKSYEIWAAAPGGARNYYLGNGEFLVNDVVVATVTGFSSESYYEYTHTFTANGTYSIKLRVTREDATQYTSAAVTHTVTYVPSVPTVSISAPATGGTTTTRPLTLTANPAAVSPATTISMVHFRLNGIPIATAYSSPWSVDIAPPNGTYTIDAVAVDNRGFSTTSASITHTVSVTGSTDPVPATLEIWDWTTETTPSLVDSLDFTGADTTMTFSDTYINDELGTVPVKSATTVSWGGFDWGALRFTVPGTANATNPGKTFHQVIVFNKPNTAWTGYPAASGYNKDVSETHAPPFKIVMKDASGYVLHSWEMYDNLPINSWNINLGVQHSGNGHYYNWTNDDTKPIRFHWNCAQVLPWTQARCAQNAKATHRYGGVASRGLRDSLCIKTFSTNPSFPVGSWGSSGGGQSNGILNMRYMHMRPRAAATPAGSDASTDPYMNSWWVFYPAENQGKTGHAYEPGNPGFLDQNTALGGVRFDRGGLASPICEVMAEPNKIHGMTQKPYREILDHVMLNCFNMAFHLTGDVATGAPALGKTNTYLCGANGSNGSSTAWGLTKGYYLGGGPYVVGGFAQSWDQVGMGQGSFDWLESRTNAQTIEQAMRFYKRDSTTQKIRRPYSGWCIDHMHSHQFWGACVGLFNSPMHAWHMVHALNMNMLTNNNQSYDSYWGRPAGWWSAEEFAYQGVITREKAYRLMHLAVAWWTANNHPSFGVSRTDIQTEMVRFLKTYYTNVYTPKWASASDTSPFWLGHRNLGMQLVPRLGSNYTTAPTEYYARLDDTPAGCYAVFPLALMARTGFLDYLLGLGDSQVTNAITDMVATLDKYSVDGILDAGHILSTGITNRVSQVRTSFANIQLSDIPTSWADLTSRTNPPVGSESFLKNAAGNWTEYSAWTHVQAMWAIGAHHYLRGHFPNARSTDAFNYIESVYADHYTNYVLATADLKQQGFRDWTYLHPVHGPMAPPAP